MLVVDQQEFTKFSLSLTYFTQYLLFYLLIRFFTYTAKIRKCISVSSAFPSAAFTSAQNQFKAYVRICLLKTVYFLVFQFLAPPKV